MLSLHTIEQILYYEYCLLTLLFYESPIDILITLYETIYCKPYPSAISVEEKTTALSLRSPVLPPGWLPYPSDFSSWLAHGLDDPYVFTPDTLNIFLTFGDALVEPDLLLSTMLLNCEPSVAKMHFPSYDFLGAYRRRLHLGCYTGINGYGLRSPAWRAALCNLPICTPEELTEFLFNAGPASEHYAYPWFAKGEWLMYASLQASDGPFFKLCMAEGLPAMSGDFVILLSDTLKLRYVIGGLAEIAKARWRKNLITLLRSYSITDVQNAIDDVGTFAPFFQEEFLCALAISHPGLEMDFSEYKHSRFTDELSETLILSLLRTGIRPRNKGKFSEFETVLCH